MIKTVFARQLDHIRRVIPAATFRGTTTSRIIDVWLPRELTDSEVRALEPHLTVIDCNEREGGWMYGLEGDL